MTKGIYYEKIKEEKMIEISGVIYDDENIIPDQLPNEVWIPISESVVPNVQPYYYISDHGRLYSTAYKNGKGGFKSLSIKDGYETSSLMKKDLSLANVRINRLVMLTFDPIFNPSEMIVNHKDGNKTNNNLDNLEWCTPKENVQHAYDTNLTPRQCGESNHNAKHTEELVRKICEGLELRLSIEDCTLYAGLELTRQNRAYVSRIKRGDIWTHISCEYDIPQEKYGNQRRFNDEDANTIFCYFEQGLSPTQVVNIIEPDLQGTERDNLIRLLYKMKNRENYQEISQYYDF